MGASNQSTTAVKLLTDWIAATDATYGTSFGTGAGFGDGTSTAGYIQVPASKFIALDLNGHDIDRSLTSPQGTTNANAGRVILNRGTLVIKDTSTDAVDQQGKITGGYNSLSDSSAGGIYSISSASLTIEGGQITGNKVINWGGGVFAIGTFIMTGGRISNNIANYNGDNNGGAGGVYDSSRNFTMTGGEIVGNYVCGNAPGGGLYDTYNLKIGGTAKITGNVSGATFSSTNGAASGGAADNVYLKTGLTVTCSTTTPLTGTSPIGVTTQTVPTVGTPVAVTGSNATNLSGHFTSDKSAYEIYNDSNTVKLRAVSTYTVTFNANGHGTAPAALTGVTSGSAISAPTEPTESGYTFGGWYKEAGCTTAWNFASDTVTANTTLYAKWTANTYTVTFNANGHGTAPAELTGVTSGSAISAPTVPTASGYTFGGWYKEAGCTNQWNFASDTVTAATTLYAKWTASGGNSGSGSSGSSGSTTTTGKAEPVIVDGTEHDIGTKTTTDTTTTVTVDNSKLQEQLEGAKESVIVPITTKTDTTVAQLVVKNVEDMAKKDMTLTVDIGDVQYNMPTTAVDTAALMKDLGATDASKVPVNVTIKNLEQSAVTVKNGELMLNPVEFTVTATYGGKTAEVERFSQYVQRDIEIPTGTDASKITTALRVEDGEHVPTYVFQKGGKWYARINSLTNSTYTLIYNEQSFADAAGKWYEKTADEMASRCVIFGRTNGDFDGGASITRAEFAAIVVRALGLPESGTSSFSDVASSAWCYGAVSAASEYGIVCGYTDGSFRPNANITRQEAMAMVARAAKVAELNGVTTADLSKFSDAATVGAWAREYVTYNVANGLIVGNNGYLKPNADISRAETATVILRLLQKAGLVDVRSAT